MILPAIDLLGGQSVRLLQGNYNAVTVVDSDPIAQAKKLIRPVYMHYMLLT